MKNEFVPTQNFQRFQTLCNELLADSLGVEMAAVLGSAGKGKTSSAWRTFTMNPQTVYVLYQQGHNYLSLLREIAFRLAGVKPRFRDACFETIQNELARQRRIIMVDEADSMNLKCLNGLRNIHDICKVPILLIGEESLMSNLSRERRLISRVREIITFEPVSQPDVVIFYRKCLDLALTPEHSARLVRHSRGDFRVVMTDAVHLEKLMRVSGLDSITDALIDEVCKRNPIKGYDETT